MSESQDPRFRILIVDDEPAILQLIEGIVRLQGWEAFPFASPSQALGRVRFQKFDALVLDIYMPEMSGLLFHAKLKVLDPDLAGRTLFISGYISRPELRRELTGMNAFLEKPFTAEAVASRLRGMLPPRPR